MASLPTQPLAYPRTAGAALMAGTVSRTWNTDNELYRGIRLCAESPDRSILEPAATLLHEMAHLYNLEHDIQDVSSNGYSHSKPTVDAHGLRIEKHRR